MKFKLLLLCTIQARVKMTRYEYEYDANVITKYDEEYDRV